MDSSIVIPITLWSSSQPKFRISSITVTPNLKKMVTGCHDGKLGIWNLNITNKKVKAKAILLGHNSSITCLVSTNEYFISTCEGGDMFRWSLDDGYCEKKRSVKNSQYIHRNFQLLKRKPCENEFLFTCGDYPGVLVYHSVTLQLICKFFSKTDYNWVVNFCSFLKTDREIVILGITLNSYVKTWIFNDNVNTSGQELSSKSLHIEKIIDFKMNYEQSLTLIIAKHCSFLFNMELNSLLDEFNSKDDEELSGGNFIYSSIVIWTKSGRFYLYIKSNQQYILKTIFFENFWEISLFKSAVTLAKSEKDDDFYFIRGDHLGQISIWMVNNLQDESGSKTLLPLLSTAIRNEWVKMKKGFFDNIVLYTSVTCCVYVPLLDKFFLGCLNGNIFVVCAMQTLMSVYMHSSTKMPSYDTLSGHKGKVNCLLYPHQTYSHHDKAYLVSGATDFSVCLWNIENFVLLHKFCVQSGEIQSLLVPPENFHSHVRHSICSISSDHSVAILNLLDRRCIILTSRHSYPVVSVNWKPLDDFLLVECFDGSVFVWETETGFLDRVLYGLEAQEVLYACEDPTSQESAFPMLNFYIRERTIQGFKKDHLLTVECGQRISSFPVRVNEFQTSDTSQIQIWEFDLERTIKKLISGSEFEQDDSTNEKLYYLTQISGSEASKKSFLYLDKIRKEKIENFRSDKIGEQKENYQKENCCRRLEKIKPLLRFLLSSLHIWDLDFGIDELVKTNLGFIKPDLIPSFGIFSSSGAYTLFLPSEENPIQNSSSLITSTSIIMMSLSRVLKFFSVESLKQFSDSFEKIQKNKEKETSPWERLFRFYEALCSNGRKIVPRPKMEILAKVWQSKCLPLRIIVQKLLPNHLESLEQQDYLDLLKFWYDYLPHFKISGKALDRSDHDSNVDMKAIALVLFGTVGSDLKFKSNFPTCQENYIYQTCSSLVYLLLLTNSEDKALKDLQTMAIDFIGRGYIVWEQYLKIEKIYPILFQLCKNMLKKRFGGLLQAIDIASAAHKALKAIALSRTSAFISCLISEINQPLGAQSRIDGFSIENSKPEMLSIVVYLLEKSPYIMLLHLNEVVSIFIYCIDATHLRQEKLNDLLPIMSKFRQVDHSVTSQRIAVGLGTGSIVLFDLRTGRTLTVLEHNDSIAVIKFSEDGRYLASYSIYENRLIFWQVFTGMFGLRQIQMKLWKSYQTPLIHDEEITNHLEVAELIWTGNKSVTLRLCDGTETMFTI